MKPDFALEFIATTNESADDSLYTGSGREGCSDCFNAFILRLMGGMTEDSTLFTPSIQLLSSLASSCAGASKVFSLVESAQLNGGNLDWEVIFNHIEQMTEHLGGVTAAMTHTAASPYAPSHMMNVTTGAGFVYQSPGMYISDACV